MTMGGIFDSSADERAEKKIDMLLKQPKVNYQKILDITIEELEARGEVPRLLLHSCCAPCSSYVLEYLTRYFSITLFYYNPNIYPPEEYGRRVGELKRLVLEMPAKHPVSIIEGTYSPERFYEAVRGLEDLPEGGKRCERCYRERLTMAAREAAAGGFDCFTTTLSISPMKNAAKLNSIGGDLAKEYGVAYLYSDFKKKEGYKRSIELSAEYGLYRQDYCGCEFSLREREKKRSANFTDRKHTSA